MSTSTSSSASTAVLASLDCPADLGSRQGWTPLDCKSAARIVVFAGRRTGSSLLLNQLRAHPEILMHGELFHVKSLREPEDGYVGRKPILCSRRSNAIASVQTQPACRPLGCVLLPHMAGLFPCQHVFERRRRDPLPILRYVQCHHEGHRAVGLKVFRDHTRRPGWSVLLRCVSCPREAHCLLR